MDPLVRNEAVYFEGMSVKGIIYNILDKGEGHAWG